MDCREIRERLLRDGAPPVGAEVDAHNSECASCAALSASGGALATTLTHPEVVSVDVDGMFRSLRGQIEAERGVLAWFRSRPTGARRLLLTAASFPIAALLLWRGGLRSDFGVYPQLRMAAILVALLGTAFWLLVTATRPLHRPQPSSLASIVWSLLGVGVGFAIALLPVAHEPTPGAPGTLQCYLAGLVIGLPLLLGAILLRRHASLGAALLFSACAGLTSNLVIQLSCSAVDHTHLVLGHATVGLTYTGFALGLTALLRFSSRNR